jgi:predicted CxxxxCH...CXXCH cytochrome family protein
MKFYIVAPVIAAATLLMGCAQLNSVSTPIANKCLACHSLPPSDAMHFAHVDTMNYSCDVCHPGASITALTVSPGHSRGVVQVHIEKAFDTAGVSTYNPATSTCSSIYCHGSFLPGNRGVVKTTDTITGCSFCHATPPTDRMHAAHIDTMHYSCSLCHPGATDSQLTTSARETHANGVVDVHIAKQFDSTGVTYYDPVKQTCNLSYCHGSVIRGDSGIVNIKDTVTGCGFCHDLGKLRLVAHHVDTLIELPIFYKCGLCHPGYNLATKTVNDSLHINGRIDVAGCDQCHELRTWVGL